MSVISRRHAANDPRGATRQKRVVIAGALFGLAFLTIAGRLTLIPMTSEDVVRARAATPASLPRANVLDRNGNLLATDLPIASLYADARHIWNPQETAEALIKVLPDLDPKDLVTKLSSKHAFIWLKRDITPKQQAAIFDLGYPGLAFRPELKRTYPNSRMASHILGFVDIDNQGLTGVEARFEKELRDPARGGAPIELALDLRIQHLLEEELAGAMKSFKALGATGLVTDIHTGEILAMASLPDFDPNRPNETPDVNRFSRATLGVYEMGSTFKTFTTAMALDTGVVTLNSGYDASEPLRIGKYTITDYHAKNRWLSVSEIFKYSSNIGSARMANDVGAERQRDYLGRLGLLTRAPVELKEVGEPLLPQRWGVTETLTVGFGHGISVSPVQLAAAIGATVNGGIYIDPTIIKRQPGAQPNQRRVMSAQTSEIMRRLLRLVVTEGTATLADVPGYPVGGKTGTAEKARGGIYARKALLSSFVGVFPALNPKYLALVLIDEPKPNADTHGYATGGWTAAPTAGRVIARIAPMLGLEPEPFDPNVVRDTQQVAAVQDDH